MKDTRTQPGEEVTLNEKKIEEKLTSLLKNRKGQINHLQNCLNLSHKNASFMKTINLVQKFEEVDSSFHKKPTKMMLLKSYYVLGSFLSSTLDLPNCNEKLQIVLRMITDFETFIEQLPSMEEKFLVSSLPQISLAPPSLKIKIEVMDLPQNPKESSNSGSKFQNATSRFMSFLEKNLTSSSNKKMLQINEKRYHFSDKRIFVEYFKNSYKVSQLTQKISFFTIISTLCEILDILLTAFLDEAYFTRDSYDYLKRIDELIHENIIKIIYRDLFKISWQEVEKELKIFSETIRITENNSIPPLNELSEELKNS